jgi:hypothetical protein
VSGDVRFFWVVTEALSSFHWSVMDPRDLTRRIPTGCDERIDGEPRGVTVSCEVLGMGRAALGAEDWSELDEACAVIVAVSTLAGAGLKGLRNHNGLSRPLAAFLPASFVVEVEEVVRAEATE